MHLFNYFKKKNENPTKWKELYKIRLFCRSLEDINTVLEYAKLELSDVKPTVQCIYFSQQLDNQSFKLLELDDTVLETLTNGEKYVLT